MANEEELEAFYRKTLSLGSKVAGGIAGAIATMATQQPVIGAALSPFVAHNLERVGSEVIARRLAPRQEMRVGRAIIVAASLARERQSAGGILRHDAFFASSIGTERSPADEVTEAVLEAAMRANEERKVDFIAALIASVSFDEDIDVATAHMMISMVNNLTWRSFCILRLASDGSLQRLPARGREEIEAPSNRLQPLAAEILDMHRRGLIEMKENDATQDHYAVLGVTDIDPAKLFLSPLGTLLSRCLQLERMSADDDTLVATAHDLDELARSGQGPRTILDGGEF